jgi:hypothetical protein
MQRFFAMETLMDDTVGLDERMTTDRYFQIFRLLRPSA